MVFRIRKEDENGDMMFGHSAADFHIDDSAGVALLLQNRLNLWEGQWYLNLTEGTPYFQQILGNSTAAARSAAIRDRVATTPFVRQIEDFSVTDDRTTRRLAVSAKVTTFFSATISITVPVSVSGS